MGYFSINFCVSLFILHCFQSGVTTETVENKSNKDAATKTTAATSVTSTTASVKSWYQQQANRYYKLAELKRKWDQVQLGRKKWPKKKGRCQHASWMIDNVNPVMEEAKRGNMVVVVVFRPGTRYGIHQLNFFNDNAYYYRKVGRPLSVLVLVERGYKIPIHYPYTYKHVRFYQEPRTVNIMKQLHARTYHVVVYDVCGRQQYLIGAPYSYTAFNSVRSAINNAYYHYQSQSFCGKCLPYTAPARRTTAKPNNDSTKLAFIPSKRFTTIDV